VALYEGAATGEDALPTGNSHTVASALASLSPEHRAVIVLRHLLEYTPGEIAELLELPRGTVNSRLRRGLDELGERIREEVR
jgi:RNA polymerase sigma-70 factor (ECF subfamily)